MPTVRGGERATAQLLASVLSLAAGLRLVAAILGGFIALSDRREDFDPLSQRAGGILRTFGAAGDTIGALLVLTAAALITWAGVRSLRLHIVVRALLLVTAVLVCLGVAGSIVLAADFNTASGVEESIAVGFGIADLSLCVGGWYVLGRIPAEDDVGGDSPPDPLVFAVDRGNGEVFAFFSYAEAVRTISAYSIEDNEFDFYTDEGDVIEAEVVDERPQFIVTEDNRREALVSALTKFAVDHDLDVEADDDLTAYALPIIDWQWLELWPRWMRGLGRMVNRLRR